MHRPSLIQGSSYLSGRTAVYAFAKSEQHSIHFDIGEILGDRKITLDY